MNRWEGPISFLNTPTEDRRAIMYNPPIKRAEHVPVLMLEAHRIRPVGMLDSLTMRGKALWGEGEVGSYSFTKLLEDFKQVPCGVDISSLLFTDAQYTHGVIRIWDWKLVAVTLYLGYEKPAFGNETFIRLKEPT